MWVRVLLPMLSAKSSCNPQARDLILQLVERLDITEMNNLISFAPSSIIHFCVCVYICDFMAFPHCKLHDYILLLSNFSSCG